MVFPSVNIMITLALEEAGSKSWIALEKASAWLVAPPAISPSTAFFKSSVEVISPVSATATLAKLTIPMWLPEPIFPSWELSVDSSIISIKVFAPSFILARGLPVMLPERSSTRTMSVGLEEISGAAESPRVTFTIPSQSILETSISLFAFVMPITLPPYYDKRADSFALNLIICWKNPVVIADLAPGRNSYFKVVFESRDLEYQVKKRR